LSGGEYLGQEEFEIAMSPARVAYLISAGSEVGYRRSVQEASTRWGGFSEPIVPVEPTGEIAGLWRQLAEFANVDEAVNVDLNEGTAKKAALHLGLPLVGIEKIDIVGVGRFTCNPAATSARATTTTLSMQSDTGIETVPTVWQYAANTLDLWAITAAGALTEDAMAAIGGFDDAIAVVDEPQQVAIAQIAGLTGMDRTALQFAERWATPPPSPSSAIIWLCEKSDSLTECLLYWNRRALRPLRFERWPMLLLPEDEVDAWTSMRTQIHAMLVGRADEFSPDAFVVSNTVSQERCRQIADAWGLVETSEDPTVRRVRPPPPPRTPPFTYLVDRDPTVRLLWRRRYGMTKRVATQVFRDRTVVSFESPVNFGTGGRFKLNLSSPSLRVLPEREVVARLVDPNGVWRDGGLEMFTYVMREYDMRVRIPPLTEVVAAILGHTTRFWQLSDKGRMGDALASIGSLSELLDRGLLEAVRDLTTWRSDRILREVERREHTTEELDRAKFVAENGGRLERRSQSATELQQVPGCDRAAVLELLVAMEWVERGYRIVCERCGITSFVELDRVTSTARCPGCRSGQKYNRSEHGVTVYYRLNSLIDRASDQGVLPHLVTIAALGGDATSAHILPGIDVEFADGLTGEVDVFGVRSGQIIAGEVKTKAADFSVGQMTRDFELSTRLGADIHVMACLEELPEAQIESAQALAIEHERELLIFDATQLRP
jgi:hypothetical protein